MPLCRGAVDAKCDQPDGEIRPDSGLDENLPEAIPKSDVPSYDDGKIPHVLSDEKQVVVEHGKEHVPPVTTPVVPVKVLPTRRTLGLRRRTFWVAFVLLIALITGAIVGGVVGSNAVRHHDVAASAEFVPSILYDKSLVALLSSLD